jgi:uncharacterized protein (UPF0332 family)
VTAGREDLVRYRRQRAHETLAEADLMAETGHWNACLNRLYYACFYAVSALLLGDGESASKHSGVRALFNRRYGRSGAMPVDLVRLYDELFDRRNAGDYVDLVWFEEEQVRPWLSQAHTFVERVEERPMP